MQYLPVDAALRLSWDRAAQLRRDAEGIRAVRAARRRRRRPVSPPVTPRPGGGIAA